MMLSIAFRPAVSLHRPPSAQSGNACGGLAFGAKKKTVKAPQPPQAPDTPVAPSLADIILPNLRRLQEKQSVLAERPHEPDVLYLSDAETGLQLKTFPLSSNRAVVLMVVLDLGSLTLKDRTLEAGGMPGVMYFNPDLKTVREMFNAKAIGPHPIDGLDASRQALCLAINRGIGAFLADPKSAVLKFRSNG